MKRIVTFGEIMLRLAPPAHGRFVQAEEFTAVYGGGEANVAISLACLGAQVRYVTKVPAHEIGQAAVNTLRRYGVDTSKIARGGNRLGVYFLEKGASQRPSKVIYDRAASAISEAVASDFDWDDIFEGVDWFHFTGITPAISESAAALSEAACVSAKEHGVFVSCDLNYRKKLWTREQAGRVMARLMAYVDLCVANEEDASDVFGIRAENTDISGGKLNHEGYESVARQLIERFGFKKVAITLRTSKSADDNDWAAMLFTGEEALFSRTYPIHIVDRVGGGDSFCAGLIYKLSQGTPDREALEFAVAASCLKHTIEGDYNLISESEAEKLAGGDGSGRVQR